MPCGLAVLHHSPDRVSDICLKTLHAHRRCEDILAHCTLDPNTPFDPSCSPWVDSRYELETAAGCGSIIANIMSSNLILLLTLGWHVPRLSTRRRSLNGMARRVLYFDTLGEERRSSGFGSWHHLFTFPSCSEFAWVPGRLQRDFARRLGFADSKIHWNGYLAWTRIWFEKVYASAASNLPVKPKAFLFRWPPGKAKGVRVLAQGYAQ